MGFYHKSYTTSALFYTCAKELCRQAHTMTARSHLRHCQLEIAHHVTITLSSQCSNGTFISEEEDSLVEQVQHEG